MPLEIIPIKTPLERNTPVHEPTEVIAKDGLKAFKKMFNLVQPRRREPITNSKLLGLPSCLAELLDSYKGVRKCLPCCICGKIFNSPNELVAHSNSHGPHDNPSHECGYCGQNFQDDLVLELHQICKALIHKCNNCFVTFENYNELNHHTCEKRSKSSRIKTGLVCEMGCSKERQYESEEALELHLYSLHGGSMDDDLKNREAMKFCMLCKGFINAYRLSLEDHTFFRCTGRHPWVKENILSLYRLAQEKGLKLSTLIQVDLESQYLEWKARDGIRKCTSGMAANLPPESERVIAGDNKYNIGDPVLQLPQLFNAMLDGKRDTLKIFHLWNQIINLTFQMRVPDEERTKSFGELSAKLYKDLTLRMPPLKSRRKRKFHIPETEENSAFKKLDLDLENAPSGDVLERLHKQLGSIASTRAIEEPVKSDCMMLRTMGMRVREFNSGDLQDEYVPYPLIETNHEEQEEEEDEDDMINPSDFLEVQQS